MTVSTTPVCPPGRAGDLLRSHPERFEIHDIYDSEGAAFYHDVSLDDQSEVAEILERVAAQPGRVLDLAAGSGRLTMPMLEAGAEVTALDLSGDMLALLRTRLGADPALASRCRLVQADMTDFALDESFTTVVLGTTSISLLPSELRPALYGCIRAHLAPGGQLLVSTLERGEPDNEADADEIIMVIEGASGQRYLFHDYWPNGASQRWTTLMPMLAEGPIPVGTSQVGTVTAETVSAELRAAGFTQTDARVSGGPDQRYCQTWMRWVVAS